jgi:hypothetical protein
MSRKNSYTLPFGPADEQGQLVVSGNRLLASIQQINDLFPMDYSGLEGWTGELRVKPVNRPAIERLRRAYELWSETGFYPADFEHELERLEQALEATPGQTTLSLEAETMPEHGVHVMVSSLPVRNDGNASGP